MTLFAILAILFAFTQAAFITLPVTQDFAVVNPDLTQSVISTAASISLFNNGRASSLSYYGIDTYPLIEEASITTNSPVAGIIEEARLVFTNFTIISEQVGAINIQISSLNPGQIWNENTVTVGTTPTIQGSLGTVDFSQEKPSLDVTDHLVQSLSGSFQGGLFGFYIGLPGGPVSVPSHRADSDAIVLEIYYSPMVGPGVTAPPTSSTAAPSTTTGAPTTTTTGAPNTPTTTGAPGAPTTTGAPSTPTTTRATTTSAGQPTSAGTTSTGSPQAPQTSSAQPTGSSDVPQTTTAVTTSPERSSAVKLSLSALVLGVLISLWL